MLLSILNCQTALAKALIVDYAALSAAQQAGDVLGSHQILVDAFQTDVRPLLRQVRSEMDVPTEPMAALRADAYVTNIWAERGTGSHPAAGTPVRNRGQTHDAGGAHRPLPGASYAPAQRTPRSPDRGLPQWVVTRWLAPRCH